MAKGKDRAWHRRVAQTAYAALWVLTAGVLLQACSKEATKPSAAEPIRFSYQNRIGSAIPIVAVEKGLFAKHGLKVIPSRFSSGPACAEALYTGAADIGAMGDTTSIIAMARKAPLRLLVSHACGEHRHRLIVAGDAPFRTVQDLVDKRVGIKKGTSTYGGFLKYLAANGISPDSIEVVNLKPGTMPDALAAGSVDAFAASEPTPSLGEIRGGRELATFGDLGNTYPIMMLVTERLVQDRPEDLTRFLEALAEAERFIEAQRGEAVALIAKSIGLPEDVIAKAMDRHMLRLSLDDATLKSLRETAEFLRDQGVIKTVPEFPVIGTGEGQPGSP